MKKRIQLGEFQFPREEWELISKNAKKIITGLLNIDPGQLRVTPEIFGKGHPLGI